MQTVVEQFNLSKWLGQEEARTLLVQAGYRGQAPYVDLSVLPPGHADRAAAVLGVLPVRRDRARPAADGQGRASASAPPISACTLPILFLKNKIAQAPAVDQARLSGRARPAADLRRIRHVDRSRASARWREEIGSQSIALAEELTLTTAELSYLPDRRQAYENLGQAHRSRRRQVGLHGAAAGRALRHAARRRRCA